MDRGQNSELQEAAIDSAEISGHGYVPTPLFYTETESGAQVWN